MDVVGAVGGGGGANEMGVPSDGGCGGGLAVMCTAAIAIDNGVMGRGGGMAAIDVDARVNFLL